MAQDERQEAPSARKIQRARDEGNVAKSPEVVGFIVFVVGIFSIFVLFPFWIDRLKKIYQKALFYFSNDLSASNVIGILADMSLQISMILAPLFFVLVIGAIVSNIAQFGFILSPKAILPKLSKINPINGFKNVFSLKKLLDGLLITLKVIIAFVLGGVVLSLILGQITRIGSSDLFSQMIWIKNSAMLLIFTLLVLFLVMASIDFFLKRYQYIKSLRMTKQEVKDEFRQQEGNPEIKSRQRQMMLKNTMGKMMKSIPEADVVITNPTHYAIALRFNATDPAPVVVAKGIDFLAIRIKNVAREHNIEIVENPKLARAIYAEVDLEKPIPRSMFEAVAVIFAQIRRMQQAKK
ncbi:MAG: flagellar biosynthesis protein FlhB [Helicobacter sp.]|nr:flagellar biosynthesis protein FlhB [Helicobacter sp.]